MDLLLRPAAFRRYLPPLASGLACLAASWNLSAQADRCGSGQVVGGSIDNSSWDFFTNYGNYMPRVDCLQTANGDSDWPWIIALIILHAGVITSYLLIYRFWRRCHLAEAKQDRNEKLMQLAYIFVLCAICGYGFSIVMFFWPVYRLLAIALVALNIVSWKFVSKLKPFELSFQAGRFQRQLNEQLAREKETLAAKNRELTQASEELAETVEQLQTANRELDDFAHAASHDLKTPLRAIHHLTEFIAEDLADCGAANAKADLIALQRRVLRMERMLDGLLHYSRIGRQPERYERCSLQDVVSRALSLLEIPPTIDVLPQQMDIEMTVARTPLEQVIRTLVDNAVKHHDAAEGRIEITANRLGDMVEIAIEDDGPGIAPEYQQRIFGMFQTLKRRDEVEGSGIGLALVERTVQRNGGQVAVESTPGEGALFRFTWPIDRDIPPTCLSSAKEEQYVGL